MSTAEETAGGETSAWGEVTPDAARRLLIAAVEAFAERGYHATTTRDIAGRAGMSPAALYIHYKTKEELLHRISRIGHAKALEILQVAARREGTATERLTDAVSSFVRWHAGGRTTARVVQYELDSLGPDARAEILALRRQCDAEIRGIIEDGMASGEFDVLDVKGTTLAVMSLCIDVARWFNVDGPWTPDEVGALDADLVLRMVGATKYRLQVVPRHRLRHAHRLVAALALHAEGDGDLDTARHVVDAGDLRGGAQPGAHGYRGGETHLVRPVVDAHLHALDLDQLRPEQRQQGEGEIAVRDRGAEGARGGLLRVDMDPLVVAGGLREQIDALLVDLQPVGVPQLLAHRRLQVVRAREDPRLCHVPASSPHDV
jgi:AcrR family transcriptional regulator